MENTAKNFALQLGSLISLYVSIGALIGLLFNIITILYPDTAQYGSWELSGASSGIRSTIAILVVFFPTYLILTRLVNQVRRTESGTYLTLTRWLIYISLLIGGGVLLGDLVTVLNSFLNGEITIRFALKALAVLLVVGSAFWYYILDVRGYWQMHEKNSVTYAGVVTLAVVVSVVFGFMQTESPQEVRERNIDMTQLTDLQSMQSHIELHLQVKGSLPKDVAHAYLDMPIPVAPEGRASYQYAVVNETNFKLCAEFAKESLPEDSYTIPIVTEPGTVKNAYTWEHGAGMWCFERAVNPVTSPVLNIEKPTR